MLFSTRKVYPAFIFEYPVLLLLFVYLLFAVFNTQVSDIAAGALLLLGFVSLLTCSKGLPVLAFERLLVWLFAVYALTSLISFLIFEGGAAAQNRLEDDSKFLFCLPLYFLLRNLRVKPVYIVGSILLVSFLLGCVSLLQAYGANLPVWDYLFGLRPGFRRPSGDVNPMRYAAFSLVLAVSSLLLIFIYRPSFIKVLVILLAALMGGIACILTETRGLWLAMLCFVAYAFWVIFSKKYYKYIISFVLLIPAFLVFMCNVDLVEERVNKTKQSLERYSQGDAETSLGTRLDMYKVSWMLFEQSPFIGHGLHSFKTKTHAMRHAGELDGFASQVGRRHTPHNEFFMAAVEKGVVGLFLVSCLFLVPFIIFYRACWHGTRNSIWFGACGAVLIVTLFVAGQTGTVLHHNVLTHFYIIWVLLFVSQIRRESPELLMWKLSSQ